MRELKFKLWSKIAQCLIEWEEVKKKPHTVFNDIDYIVYQFAGEKDCEGCDIYENDSVVVKIFDSISKKVVIKEHGLVVFKNGSYGVNWKEPERFTPLSSFSKNTTTIKVTKCLNG